LPDIADKGKPPGRPAIRYWTGVLLLIAVLGVIQVLTIRDESATWDEPQYLAAGYSYWTTGRFQMNPEHPPLAKLVCALPLRLFYNLRLDAGSPEWQGGNFVMVGNLFLYRNRASPDDLLFAGRVTTIGMTLLFAAYMAWWTRRRFGAGVGLFAVALFAFDPNIIAHGRYATNDLMLAFFVFTTVTLWLEYLVSSAWLWTVLAGVSLGLAFATKFSSLFLSPVLVAMAAACAWRARQRIARLTAALAVAGILSILVLAIVYSPELAHYRELPALSAAISPASPLAFLAGPLHAPAFSLLVGIDRLIGHNAGGHPAYLLGRVSDRGWWYYFPVAFAVKTVSATLAGIVILLVMVWRSKRRLLLFALLFPPAAYFGIAMLSHIDIGVRHLLPIYPFLYVATGCVMLERRILRPAAVAIAVLAAIESLAIYPDYLAFFNVMAGGPEAGPRYLLDSNIDWGQDFKKLGRYLQRRGTPDVCLGFFANVDFPYYGMRPRVVPEGAAAQHPNCVIAMSATVLFGQYVGPARFAWLRDKRPDAIIGHSIYVYDLRAR
jgi:hypothetical protein